MGVDKSRIKAASHASSQSLSSQPPFSQCSSLSIPSDIASIALNRQLSLTSQQPDEQDEHDEQLEQSGADGGFTTRVCLQQLQLPADTKPDSSTKHEAAMQTNRYFIKGRWDMDTLGVESRNQTYSFGCHWVSTPDNPNDHENPEDPQTPPRLPVVGVDPADKLLTER